VISAAANLAGEVGVAAACRALRLPRSALYRHRVGFAHCRRRRLPRRQAVRRLHYPSMSGASFWMCSTARPRGAFKIKVNGKSCSVWSEERRILRAKQSKPGAKVLIKLVQSSSPDNLVEFAWDGNDSQIESSRHRTQVVIGPGGSPRVLEQWDGRPHP
jgi:hypothetical protein